MLFGLNSRSYFTIYNFYIELAKRFIGLKSKSDSFWMKIGLYQKVALLTCLFFLSLIMNT